MSRVGDSTHGIEASQDHDDKEKREERREKSEERREKKEEKRDPKRGRQRSPNEAARGVPTLFYAMPPPGGSSGGLCWGSVNRSHFFKGLERVLALGADDVCTE